MIKNATDLGYGLQLQKLHSLNSLLGKFGSAKCKIYHLKHVYASRVTAATLRWHMPNMNVIYSIEKSNGEFWSFWNNGQNNETEKMCSATPPPFGNIQSLNYVSTDRIEHLLFFIKIGTAVHHGDIYDTTYWDIFKFKMHITKHLLFYFIDSRLRIRCSLPTYYLWSPMLVDNEKQKQ